MRGNFSNLAAFSKFVKSFSDLYDPHIFNGCENANLLRFRLFSSVDGHNNRNGKFREGGRNDFYGGRNENGFDNGDTFSGRKGGNFGAHQNFGHGGSKPSRGGNDRGERQRGQFGREYGGDNRDYRRQGRSFGRDGNRGSMNLNDDVLKFDENGEGNGDTGLGGEFNGKKDYQPSVRDLLKGPSKVEQRGGKEGAGDGDFLEKFKLGEAGKEEGNESKENISTTQVEEDKIEEPKNADAIFNKMKKSGLIPNAVAMLDGLCKDGLVHEAMKLFGVMREKGTMPEVVVYTAVVEGFCQAHKLDDAKRIFKKMQSNGIVPNAFSYTVLIKGLCKGKRLDDATDVCVEMLEAGHAPNVPTFTWLVHEFCKEKGVVEARKVIDALKQKGLSLDEKAVRVYLDKSGPTSPLLWEAIFGPKKTERAF